MSKHTPGPWKNKNGYLIGADGSEVVAAAIGLGLGSDSGDGVRLANGDLIKAAPELLFALKACAAVCSGQAMNKNGLVNALELARSAIAKAEGA